MLLASEARGKPDPRDDRPEEGPTVLREERETRCGVFDAGC